MPGLDPIGPVSLGLALSQPSRLGLLIVVVADVPILEFETAENSYCA